MHLGRSLGRSLLKRLDCLTGRNAPSQLGGECSLGEELKHKAQKVRSDAEMTDDDDVSPTQGKSLGEQSRRPG
jgi:hypothetical protein